MMIHAGIDEAGLGPTLGPLTASVTAFEYEDGLIKDSWAFSKLLVPEGIPSLQIGDSKKVYSPKKGIQHLEQAVFAVFAYSFSELPRHFSELVQGLTGREYEKVFERSPWFAGQDLKLPVTDIIFSNTETVSVPGLKSVFCASRILNVPLFNARIMEGLNKGDVLFVTVGSMIEQIIEAFKNRDIDIVIDRLGGRKFYYRYLMETFLDWNITRIKEDESESGYRMVKHGRCVTVTFKVKADASDFFVAVSSLVSKYLRELSMILFNRYFAGISPHIKETHGYPTDAKRFLNEISGTISPDILKHLVRVR